MKNKFYIIIPIVLSGIISTKTFAQKPVTEPKDSIEVDGDDKVKEKRKPIFEKSEPQLNLSKILKDAEKAGKITTVQISVIEIIVQDIKMKKFVRDFDIINMARLSRLKGIEKETAINFADKVFDLITIYRAQKGYSITNMEKIVYNFPEEYVYQLENEHTFPQRIYFSEDRVQIGTWELATLLCKCPSEYSEIIKEQNKEIARWISGKSTDRIASEKLIKEMEYKKRLERMEGKGEDHEHGSR